MAVSEFHAQNKTFQKKLKGLLDLTRAHFAIVWPLLFCSGAMLAFGAYGGFSWLKLLHVGLIGLFGFEAGMVLNDILDHDIDHIELDEKMTNYWRPFKNRPIPSGIISFSGAVTVFALFLAITIGLIALLPFPNMLYVYGIMLYAYLVESFYNMRKRKQKVPLAQILGRTDLTVFPVAGYLCFGQWDINVLLFVLFLYPWALAHLATNDLLDYENDKAKDLKTITVLYGDKGNLLWIGLFTAVHILFLPVFIIIGGMSYIALAGFIVAAITLITAFILLVKDTINQKKRMLPLPLFHASLFIYTITISLDSVLLPSAILPI
jgi:4-hydroxybenzoate polyprenyltransferase